MLSLMNRAVGCVVARGDGGNPLAEGSRASGIRQWAALQITSLVCLSGESKADTQPRNEVRSVVSAGPSCQRRRKASHHSPGLLDSFPGAVAPAPAKFSDSALMERSGKAGRQWGDRAAESSLARSPAAGCQTNLVLPVRPASFA